MHIPTSMVLWLLDRTSPVDPESIIYNVSLYKYTKNYAIVVVCLIFNYKLVVFWIKGVDIKSMEFELGDSNICLQIYSTP